MESNLITTTNVTTGETEDIIIDEGTDTANFKFKKDAFKTIAVSIDANKKFIIYYDGKKYFESSALASVQDQYYVSRSGSDWTTKSLFLPIIYLYLITVQSAQPNLVKDK